MAMRIHRAALCVLAFFGFAAVAPVQAQAPQAWPLLLQLMEAVQSKPRVRRWYRTATLPCVPC